MALSDKGFVDKINSCLTGTLSEIQNAQLADSISKISSNKVESVATFAILPVASENTGRMIFVVAEDVYYYSDGEIWTKDLKSNLIRKLYVWGRSDDGILGDGTTTSKCSPISIYTNISDWCQVSSGRGISSAIELDGSLWTWGTNTEGGLGDGTTVNRCFPVPVIGNFLWCKVATGSNHAIAIRNDGTLWAWGSAGVNDGGQLGDGTTVSKSSPVSVRGGFTDWCQVSVAGTWSAGVRTNGTIWTWGENSGINSCGQLGDGSFTNRCSPVLVAGGFTDWCQVAAGSNHGLGLRTNGTIWSWGNGNAGVLGTGNVNTRNSPVLVVGGFTDWCQVAAGGSHSVALRTNGTIWSWGDNNNSALGDGAGTNRCSPVSVVGGFTDWCRISVGGNSNMALRTNGTLWGWGDNRQGELGDGTTVNRCSPVSVIGGLNNWVDISRGERAALSIVYERGF